MLKYACGNEVRVGDIVLRIAEGLSIEKGNQYVVDNVNSECDTIDLVGERRDWYQPEYFTLISRKRETTMKTKQFTKADLKTGYRLILEDGEVGIVFMDSDIISLSYSRNWVKYINHSNGFDDLDYWDNKLNPAESTWVSKVVRVEKPSYPSDIFKLDCDVKIIWEREAPKSKEQIAYDEAVEATEAARQAYELAQKKLEALNPSGFHPANK